jgi:hypothetical protein
VKIYLFGGSHISLEFGERVFDRQDAFGGGGGDGDIYLYTHLLISLHSQLTSSSSTFLRFQFLSPAGLTFSFSFIHSFNTHPIPLQTNWLVRSLTMHFPTLIIALSSLVAINASPLPGGKNVVPVNETAPVNSTIIARGQKNASVYTLNRKNAPVVLSRGQKAEKAQKAQKAQVQAEVVGEDDGAATPPPATEPDVPEDDGAATPEAPEDDGAATPPPDTEPEAPQDGGDASPEAPEDDGAATPEAPEDDGAATPPAADPKAPEDDEAATPSPAADPKAPAATKQAVPKVPELAIAVPFPPPTFS